MGPCIYGMCKKVQIEDKGERGGKLFLSFANH
jgi:hypothetical protein